MHRLQLTTIVLLTLLVGCSSNIQQVGFLGPKKLPVYSVQQNDFLSASRMLVVLNKQGDVTAYGGGTVGGAGAVGLETAGSVLTAGSVVYAANKLANPNVKVHGVPNSMNQNINVSPDLGKNLKSAIDNFKK